MTPSQIISHLYSAISAHCFSGKGMKHQGWKNERVTFGWMSKETRLIGQTEWVRWTEGKTERWLTMIDGDPHNLEETERSMTYTQPCPTVYHLWLLGTAQGLEEEERWRSLSVPSPCRCLETSHLSVCHWLWGYLASLIEDDSRNIRLVCVCVYLSEGCSSSSGGGFHLVSIYKTSITHQTCRCHLTRQI